MPSLTMKNQKGQDAGSITLSDAVFGVELPNEIVVREVVNAWRSNQRQGTHSTKTRAFVSGGGKKPWKQKHTGRARAGSSRSPLWRGGAIIFGPTPRDYREKTNRQKRQAAMRSILSALQADGRLIAVDSIDLSADPKTKNVVAMLDAVGANGTVLIVTKDVNEGLVRAARNIAWVRTQVANTVCVYELLVADSTVITREALTALEEMLA